LITASDRVAARFPSIAPRTTEAAGCGGNVMLRLALGFFLIAIVAAFFGFGGIATAAAEIAKILFFVFVVLFVLSLIVYVIRGTVPPVP
jgi:uncharacterized membrane protein YtjA (UPF0391 family)